MDVRVAIIGVGNCASSFVQGLSYYATVAPGASPPPGVMHATLGGYAIKDVRVVAAFDVDARKVGKTLAEAVFASPNNTLRFADAPEWAQRVTVHRGMTHDGIGQYLSSLIPKASGSTADIQQVLRDTRTDVVINYLPVGSEEATKWYCENLLAAKCALVNCIPVFIASEPYWQKRFWEAGVPIIGDDIKSQVGATIVHRVLATLMRDRGVRLRRTSQLNVGGNTDFLNMLERSRLHSKKISKTQAVTSVAKAPQLHADHVHIGPSDYVPWLEDRKWAYIRLEGEAFGGTPVNIELKLDVWDSPNSAGVVIDAVRCIKLALNRGLKGALIAPSAYFMKSPPQQYDDSDARAMVERFIAPREEGVSVDDPRIRFSDH